MRTGADLAKIRYRRPLVHQITNYVVMNETANATLALGALPVMAHAIEEVEEMASVAGALVLNIGTLSKLWIEAMLLAATAANRAGVPVVLDPVGVGATKLRTETANRLLGETEMAVVRGNAAEVATGVAAAELGGLFDTVTLCLSKGLGAPVGSLVIGSKPFVAQAHRFRKQFGGGMRQAGILAAAGLYALEHNVERLAEDHLNAKRLAQGIADIGGLDVDVNAVVTNILYFHVRQPGLTVPKFLERLRTEGVLMLGTGPNSIRAVTHLDVSKEGIDRALEVLQKVVR